MNTNRILFDRPENSKIVITKSWLLGFIEGDGSFFLRRDNLTPIFSLENTAVQLPVLLKIKEFIEASLGFDTFSLYKVQNTQIIAIASRKAITINSKSTVSITIQHINVLNNYLIPFFENEEFLTKKGKDFYDFKIICKVIYEGGHRIEKIRALILKLSNTMNNFRLSNYKGEVKFLTQEELEILLNAEPTVIRLPDGRVIDSTTKKILPKLVCCVYEILTEYGSFLLANSLSEAAKIVGLYPDTLSKYLDFNASLALAERSAPNSTEDLTRQGGSVAIKKHFIKRVRVFTGQREAAPQASLRNEYGACRQNKFFKN
uniref:LAGLIDADG endonuclease n=1 Tax=Inonotus hispidus TaxID=40469 RepID=UPI002181FE6E|nr:LAGLIDADG endonuclease [Inonotus hispidus]UVF37964.1 LAGLIDADG endonuclease [Inonotus hispidus]